MIELTTQSLIYLTPLTVLICVLLQTCCNFSLYANLLVTIIVYNTFCDLKVSACATTTLNILCFFWCTLDNNVFLWMLIFKSRWGFNVIFVYISKLKKLRKLLTSLATCSETGKLSWNFSIDYCWKHITRNEHEHSSCWVCGCVCVECLGNPNKQLYYIYGDVLAVRQYCLNVCIGRGLASDDTSYVIKCICW